MKCIIMICRSWIRILVGLNLGYMVLLSKLLLKPRLCIEACKGQVVDNSFSGHKMYCSWLEGHGFKLQLGQTWGALPTSVCTVLEPNISVTAIDDIKHYTWHILPVLMDQVNGHSHSCIRRFLFTSVSSIYPVQWNILNESTETLI